GEIIQIDRAPVLFGRLRDQLRRASIVELEAALYHRMEVGALVCQFAALDGRDAHEQGRGSKAQSVVAEIVLPAGRGGGEQSLQHCQHLVPLVLWLSYMNGNLTGGWRPD